MENILIFEEGSGTIRQMPQNYLIASKEKGHWVLDFDSAADRQLIDRVYNALFKHKNRFGTDLNFLAETLTDSEDDLKSFEEILTQVSQENDWDDFQDVCFNSEYRRTILQIVEETLDKFNNQ